MSLLVTGAMGHVGYETVRQAAALGIPVVAQYLNTFRKDEATAVGDGVTWVRCELSDPFELATLVDTHNIDGCIHTAAIPNDKLGLPIPMQTFNSNVVATQNLLELARQYQWRRFILVSTGSVFQGWTDTSKAIPESENPTPKTLYGCTKRNAELLLTMYANSYQLSAASIRISWVYGPPLIPDEFDGPRGPIPEYLKLALRDKKVEFESGGDFAASFTYVKDVAAGLLSAYQAQSMSHPVYHLGSGENYSTFRVADAVQAAVPEAHVSVGPGAAPWTDFTILRGPLACERMKDDFGFSPTYTLESAIQEFADWTHEHETNNRM